MLSVTNKPFTLSVVMLGVVMMNVIAPIMFAMGDWLERLARAKRFRLL